MGEAFITRRGGKPPVPSIFGDGSDGDLYIAAGQTVVLPVGVPHQSVVLKQYKSVRIEAGGVLRCSAHNAGLVIKCKGDFTCHGTIDQSMMSPKTNPNNNYTYPAELNTGNGGMGGGIILSMGARKYGGGWGSGGSGGGSNYEPGGVGGATNTIDVSYTGALFIGGAGAPATNTKGLPGYYGGGGGASTAGPGGVNHGAGGNGNGANGAGAVSTSASGGGAGNYGGGVLLIYCGGDFYSSGVFLCHGGSGGFGGGAYSSTYAPHRGGGGGGGGGGAFYLMYNTTYTNVGTINVYGGAGGNGSAGSDGGSPGNAGHSGGIGTITIKQYAKGMTV